MSSAHRLQPRGGTGRKRPVGKGSPVWLARAASAKRRPTNLQRQAGKDGDVLRRKGGIERSLPSSNSIGQEARGPRHSFISSDLRKRILKTPMTETRSV